MATKKTFKSNKEKRLEERNINNNPKTDDYNNIPTNISKTLGGKITNIILCALMVIVPLGALIFLLVKAIQG